MPLLASDQPSSIATRQRLVRVAQGLEPADLLIHDALIADVHTLTTFVGNVAIADGLIARVGARLPALETFDAAGMVLTPGLIDAHIHIESSLLTPRRFAEVVLPRGTVGVVAEPHEIANVIGLDGIRVMLEAGAQTPLSVWLSAPSCVPASPFEAAGARLAAADLERALELPGVLGLAEMMNYPGVLSLAPEVWAILEVAHNKRQDGHAPGVCGAAWQAYVAAGLESDHETVSESEALERLRSGTWLMVRDGSAARNLEALAPLIARLKPPRAMLVTDDADAAELLEQGHCDRLLKKAIACGIPPVYALRMLTLAPAEYWRIPQRGAVAAGQLADLVLWDSLETANAQVVWRSGQMVAKEGNLLAVSTAFDFPQKARQSVHLPKEIQLKTVPKLQPIIGVDPLQIRTEKLPPQRIGAANPELDLVKLAVVERHSGQGKTGVGFAKGIGLKRGAIAQSIAHDAHNIICAGVSDADMELAIRQLGQIQGGVVVVADGQVLALLELPVAGLMSDAPAKAVVEQQRHLEAVVKGLGCTLPHPIVTLAFLALTVIPSLKITERGLFDVGAFALLELA
ncbi:MAG: adenine deaminase [Deinococcales bacterium]